tara:strand:+ start:38 stop:316 length:279 start_codon:yes stop_codon:yes gene_type:complete
MTFIEDTTPFFEHFTDKVSFNGVIYKGILNQPDEMIADGLVMTTDYELTVKTSELGGLVFDNKINVADEKYKVRSTRKIDDGLLSIVSLIKE